MQLNAAGHHSPWMVGGKLRTKQLAYQPSDKDKESTPLSASSLGIGWKSLVSAAFCLVCATAVSHQRHHETKSEVRGSSSLPRCHSLSSPHIFSW